MLEQKLVPAKVQRELKRQGLHDDQRKGMLLRQITLDGILESAEHTERGPGGGVQMGGVPRLDSDARLPQQRRIPEYQRLRKAEQSESDPNPYAPSAFAKEAPDLQNGKHDGPEPRAPNKPATLDKALELRASPFPR